MSDAENAKHDSFRPVFSTIGVVDIRTHNLTIVRAHVIIIRNLVVTIRGQGTIFFAVDTIVALAIIIDGKLDFCRMVSNDKELSFATTF